MNPLGFAVGVLAGAAVERLAMRRIKRTAKNSPVFSDRGHFTHYELPTSDGGFLHAFEIGSGPPVVLLHGVTLNAEIWTEQFDLADQFRLIAIDLRSHGESVAGSQGASIDANAEDVLRVLEELDLHDVTMIGHSMGGMVLGRLITEHPELCGQQIGALGFISSAGRCPAKVPKWLVSPLIQRVGSLASWKPGLARQITLIPGNDLGELAVRATFGSEPNDAAVAKVTDSYNAFPIEELLAVTPSLLNFDVLEALSEIDLPTGIMVGSEDPITPPEESIFLQEALPHATLEILEGAGHQLMLERPFEVNDFIETLAKRNL